MKPYCRLADDIYCVELPLPFALKSVNCYLLLGEDGWTIVDTGLNTSQAQAGWLATFAGLAIRPEEVAQIVLTHAHPDHYGLAGWLQAWCGAPVWMSPREAELAQQIWKQDNLATTLLELFALAGLPPALRLDLKRGTEQTQRSTRPHPQSVKLLRPGAVISMGQRRFTALIASGHSDGQLIFYDPDDRLLLCGDQVLANITPHIGLWPTSEPDPLGRYLASLQELAQLEVRLALPGHRARLSHWSERLAELQEHHTERLAAMLAVVHDSGSLAFDVCARVFNTEAFSPYEIRFAVAETLAHLEYLVAQGHLRREEKTGVWLYHRAV